MEFLILNSLSFDITFPTVHRFLERYTKLLIHETTSSVIHYAYFLIDLALIDMRMLQYSCSLLAASALGHAFKTLPQGSLQPQDHRKDAQIELQLAGCLGLNVTDLQLCMKDLYFLQLRSSNSALQAVRKKYSHS